MPERRTGEARPDPEENEERFRVAEEPMDTRDDAGDEVLEDAIRQAASLGDEERWDEARDLLRETLEDAPDDPALFCWLGIASQRLGADGEAYEYFRRCLAQQPSDPFLLASAGSGLAALDDPEAESVLRLAALSGPQDPFARATYGAYLAREGLFAEAIRELEAARGLDPADGSVRAELAVAMLLAGRTEEGTAELEEAMGLVPDDAWLRGLFGLALIEAGRSEEAAEELHRAATERPDDVEVQLLSALSSAEQGWEDEAWNALARAEQAAEAVDRELLHEVEEAVEAGDEAASDFLRGHLAPSLLRERLLQRP
jgi:Flp pilus assembly protein TadD